jgi:hypothetical protein
VTKPSPARKFLGAIDEAMGRFCGDTPREARGRQRRTGESAAQATADIQEAIEETLGKPRPGEAPST